MLEEITPLPQCQYVKVLTFCVGANSFAPTVLNLLAAPCRLAQDTDRTYLTSIRLRREPFCLGIVSFKTPFLKDVLTLLSSTSAGNRTER